MGKPIKLCASYFYHDADMRNDIKIKALRRKFGTEGYAVWNFLLEVLTDSDGFELDFTKLQQELLAADFDVTRERLVEVVEYCFRLNLLQRTEDGQGVYSQAHRQRLQDVISLKEKRSNAGRIGMQKRWGQQSSDNTVITPDNTAITADNVKNSNEKKGKEKNRKENIPAIAGDTAAKVPYQEIAEMWNSICGAQLPKVQTVSDSRRAKIKARLAEFGKPEVWRERTEQLFRAVIASDFLRGANNHNWTATFDWLFSNPTNWVKVMEGNYANQRGTAAQHTAQQPTLGVGEFIDNTGRRTYGTGKTTIPANAPARPSDRHSWDAATNTWILL
jgi:hypothetical protein